MVGIPEIAASTSTLSLANPSEFSILREKKRFVGGREGLGAIQESQ